jgi:D-hexose-6-phosphate mutarotase
MPTKLPQGVNIDTGNGGLRRLTIATALGEAHIYLHGAHVTHWQPASHKPVLWLSRQAWFAPAKPIRGGVPICFPWFGPHPDNAKLPAHGLARLLEWQLESATRDAEGTVTVELRLTSGAATQAYWPRAFDLRHRVTVGRTLAMELLLSNLDAPARVEAALHSYFAIGDVRQLRVTGLSGAAYIDKADGMKRKTQDAQPIAITGETDRTYVHTATACVLEDPVWRRRIRIDKSGSSTTVLWNPWIAKAKAFADFGDDEWPTMVCLETANAADDAIAAEPGRTDSMRAEISVVPM